MKLNISGKITQYFINSQLTVLLMAATAVLGLFALAFTPREENPQIVVPAANVMVMMPGAGAKEVEELVSKRLESKLWEIPGVEDVYSVSMNSMAVVTVKFYVGQDKERSIVKLYDKLMNSMDFEPPERPSLWSNPSTWTTCPSLPPRFPARRVRTMMTPSSGSWRTTCSMSSGRCRAWATPS